MVVEQIAKRCKQHTFESVSTEFQPKKAWIYDMRMSWRKVRHLQISTFICLIALKALKCF